MKVPGPIDFRGAFVPVFALLYELGGKWLCLRLLSTDVAGPVVTDSDLEEVRLRLVDGVFC